MMAAMPAKSIDILPCPPAWRERALALVLRSWSAEQRHAVLTAKPDANGLFVATADGELVGACWAQPQPGNTAICWPPQLERGSEGAADVLLDALTKHVDQLGVGLTQTLVGNRSDPTLPLLERHGFQVLADLVYLSWAPENGSPTEQTNADVSFQPFELSQRARLIDVVEQTYEATLDCPLLDGVRPMNEVLDGYHATGQFDPSNWFIVRQGNCDVGVLLLTAHPEIRHCELVYMGVVPAARGTGLGRRIVRHAQQVTLERKFAQLVLAVDAVNEPATRIYREAGFLPWDKRTVLVRIPPARGQQQTHQRRPDARGVTAGIMKTPNVPAHFC